MPNLGSTCIWRRGWRGQQNIYQGGGSETEKGAGRIEQDRYGNS